jgi:hypothetical protein
VRVYIAARYELRKEALALAAELEAAGHAVVSRWIRGKGWGARPADNAAYYLTDIIIADAVVLLTEDPGKRLPAKTASARHVELGYALRAGKRIIVVGPRQNVFQYLPGVERFSSVAGMLRGLERGWAEEPEGDDEPAGDPA